MEREERDDGRRGHDGAAGLGLLILGAVQLLLVAGGYSFGMYGGPVERTETMERTVTGRLVEVARMDQEHIQIAPSAESVIRLE